MEPYDVSYFIRGNTARGNIDYFASNFGKLQSVFLTEGLTRTAASELLNKLGKAALVRGACAEYIRHPLDTSVEGVIFPQQSCGIFCRDVFTTTPLPKKTTKVYRTEEPSSPVFKTFHADYRTALQKAGQHYASALKIHDEWENFYIDHLDFSKMNTLTLNLITEVLQGKKLDKTGLAYDRFLGCATAQGNVDYIETLTKPVAKRYFIKGRPGTGKSTLLKKLACQAQETGFDVEIYHCGFDPHSLDMVVLRELGIALFDSTAPHETFPSRTSDTIVDVYDIAKKQDVDTIFARELADISDRYKEQTSAARTYLVKADELLSQAEQKMKNASASDVESTVIHSIEADLSNFLNS